MNDMKDKWTELLAESKLNDLVNKKDEDKCKKTVIIILAVVALVALVALVVYAVRKFLTPDYLDDFDDEFDDYFSEEDQV